MNEILEKIKKYSAPLENKQETQDINTKVDLSKKQSRVEAKFLFVKIKTLL